MAKDEYTQKLELAIGRLQYATRLIMDIIDTEGIGSDEDESYTTVAELRIARENAQAVLDGTL